METINEEGPRRGGGDSLKSVMIWEDFMIDKLLLGKVAISIPTKYDRNSREIRVASRQCLQGYTNGAVRIQGHTLCLRSTSQAIDYPLDRSFVPLVLKLPQMLRRERRLYSPLQ
jgi:hypothetical protein